MSDPKAIEVLNTLTSEDPAIAAGLYVMRGKYRIARALMALAVEISDDEAEQALTEEIAHVPLIGQTRTEHPRTVIGDVPTGINPIYEAASAELGDTQIITPEATRVGESFDEAMRDGCLCTWVPDTDDVMRRIVVAPVCPVHSA